MITATKPVRWVAWGAATWCVAFAVVNVAQESSGRFEQGALAPYAAGLAVMGWLVAALKVLGAGAALSTVYQTPHWIPVRLRLLSIWGAFALLALYSAGSLVQAGFLLITDPQRITVPSLIYVGFFLAGAVAFGVLAVSLYRRSGRDRRLVVTGLVGAPILLALLLVVAPAILGAVGVMPG